MKLKTFEEFISSGVVKKQTPNRPRALSLLHEAEEKKKFLDISLKSIPSEKMSANFIVDHCYDILIELVRANMFINGYNPGNSHEAEVSYLKNLGCADYEIIFMDELRYYRNGIKYYGTILDTDYAHKVLGFMRTLFPRLKQLKP